MYASSVVLFIILSILFRILFFYSLLLLLLFLQDHIVCMTSSLLLTETKHMYDYVSKEKGLKANIVDIYLLYLFSCRTKQLFKQVQLTSLSIFKIIY